MYRRIVAALAVGTLVAVVGGGIATGGTSGAARAQIEATIAAQSKARVGPITRTNVRLIYDADRRGLGGDYDMVGPVIGKLLYSQTDQGALKATVNINFAQPNTRYRIFLWDAPSHELAEDRYLMGAVTTDGLGRGSANVTAPLTVLRSWEFGPGYRTDHIDLWGPPAPGLNFTSSLVAGAVNYFVPGTSGGRSAAVVTSPDRV